MNSFIQKVKYDNSLDTLVASVHYGGEKFSYEFLIGGEYGSIGSIMNANDLANPSNITKTAYDARKIVMSLENDNSKQKKRDTYITGNNLQEEKIMAKFELSSISKLEGDSNVKALASVVVNGEFAVRGIKVIENEKGAFVAMPTKKVGDDFMEVCHPITAEARQAINDAVMKGFEQLQNSSEKTLKFDVTTAEKSTSQLDVSLHSVNSEHVKASGQVVIDKDFVIKDMAVVEAKGKSPFVSMPSYKTQSGDYADFALPITKDGRARLDNAVLGKYEKIKLEKKLEKSEKTSKAEKKRSENTAQKKSDAHKKQEQSKAVQTKPKKR